MNILYSVEKFFNSKIKFISARELFTIATIFILTRFLIIFVGMIGYATFPERGYSYEAKSPAQIFDLQTQWEKFDSHWYLSIAEDGYRDKPFSLESQENWAFMPLYPISIKAFHEVTTIPHFESGVILSNLYSFIALIFIHKLIKDKFSKNSTTSLHFMALLLLSAGSYFLSIVYADSLFLLLSALIFYLVHKQRFGWAFVLVGLASVTRLQGILLGVIPFIEIIRLDWKKVYIYIPAMLSSLIPISLFAWYLHGLTGNALAFIDIQPTWGADRLLPLQGFVSILRDPGTINLINGAFWGLYLTLYAFKYKEMPLSYTIYVLLYFIVSTGTETIYGITRYVLPLLPIFIAITLYGERIYKSVLYINIAILSVAILAFVTLSFLFI